MHENIDKKRRKKAPIICTVVLISILAAWLAFIVYPLLMMGMGEAMAMCILILYALMIIAVIVGILFALRQRLCEIENGEEEEAKKY